MDRHELVETVAGELDAGRPAKAYGILQDAAAHLSPTDLVELRLRTYLAVGRAEEVLCLVEQLEREEAEVPPGLLEVSRGLALWSLETSPRARVLAELAPLLPRLEGEERRMAARALAQVHLECGTPELSRRALVEAHRDDPEAPDRGSVELYMALARGDYPAAEAAAVARGLGGRDRARFFAASGDWTAVDIEIEALREAFVDDPDGLDELATYAESVRDHRSVRDALQGFEHAFSYLGSAARRSYRLALAHLRTGDADTASARLADLASGSGLAARAAWALTGYFSEAHPVELPRVHVPAVPFVDWPGVYPAAGALALALWSLGERVDPFEVQAALRIEGGDVVSSFELLDYLREQGFPFARFEGDPHSVCRVLDAGLPVVLRLALPERGLQWALVSSHDPALSVLRLHFPQAGQVWELPVSLVRELQEPVAGAAVVVAGRGELARVLDLRLKSSMALEALDQAARMARQGRLEEALARLERARGYRERFQPLWRLLAELRVVVSFGDPEDGEVEELLQEAAELFPEEAWPRLLHGRYLMEARGERDRALAVLRQAAGACHPSAEVLTEIGDLEEELGELDAAADSWWRAQRVDPLYARPREQLSRHLRRRGERRAALALCDSARESSPGNPYNWEMRGILLAELGEDPEEVEASLGKAIELNPTRPYAFGFLADVMQRSRRFGEAVAVLEQAAGRVLSPYPFLVRLAEVHFDAEDYCRCVEAAERALAALEGVTGEPVPARAVAIALRGAGLGRLGRLEEAREVLRQAIHEDPDDPWAVRELAIHLREAGHLEEAARILEEGRRRVPEDVGIRAQLALTREESGELPAALGAAREALELSGVDDFEVVRLVARLASASGELGAAEAVWRASVAASSDPEEARKHFLSFLLDMEAYEVAEREGRAGLATSPDDEELHAWQGFALLRLGRAAEAVPLLQRALALDPEYVFARSILLDALTEEGREAEAVAVFAASRGLLTPLGYECAFVAHARLGRHEEALQVCRKACMAAPRSAGFFHRRAARLLLDDCCDFPEALAEAEAAVTADPDDPRNHEVHAWCLVASGCFAEAEDAMDRMVQTGAGEEELLRFRRFLAERRGDLACEEACAARLARLTADNPRTSLAWCIDAAGRCLLRGGSEEEFWAHLEGVELGDRERGALACRAARAACVELASELLRRAGEDIGPEGLLAEAEVLARAGSLEEALERYRSLEARVPDDHRGPEGQARILLVLERYAEGLEAAERALATGRVFCGEANFLSGAARLLARDPEAAHPFFRRAATLRGGAGPDLIGVMARWSAGDPEGAGEELARFLELARVGSHDRALARLLARAAGVALPGG